MDPVCHHEDPGIRKERISVLRVESKSFGNYLLSLMMNEFVGCCPAGLYLSLVVLMESSVARRMIPVSCLLSTRKRNKGRTHGLLFLASQQRPGNRSGRNRSWTPQVRDMERSFEIVSRLVALPHVGAR